MWFFDDTHAGISDKDRAFVARVAAISPHRRLLPEEADELLDLIDRVQAQWTGRI